ncbi:MAG: Hint domain-containing protein [Paracoccaceae bacterium]
MPTTYNDQFWVMDPYAPPTVGTTLNFVNYDIVDNNNNNLINRFNNDRINGSDIRQAYPGDTITVDLPGGGTVTIIGTTFYLRNGQVVFTPSDGSVLENGSILVSTTYVTTQGSLATGDLAPPCFTPGTLILTVSGQRLVEDLRVGDLLITADRGAVPLCFVRTRSLPKEHFQQKPDHGPVEIKANALGDGYPSSDLTVSPQHRMLIRSAIAKRMFGEDEILVPACQLVGLPGIRQKLVGEDVTYIHLLLDHHAVIYAEDTPTETMFLGQQTQLMLSGRELDEIQSVLPSKMMQHMPPARLFVRGRRLRKLLERHKSNAKPLVSHVDLEMSAQALSA